MTAQNSKFRPPPVPCVSENEWVECLAIETPVGRFAVETGRMRELVSIDDVTPVPGSPASVAGITTLRGTVVVVLSGETLLDTEAELLIVFDRDDDRRLFGLSIGDVAGIEPIEMETLITPDAFDGAIPDRGLPIRAVALPMGRSQASEPTFVIDTIALGESAPEPPTPADT